MSAFGNGDQLIDNTNFIQGFMQVRGVRIGDRRVGVAVNGDNRRQIFAHISERRNAFADFINPTGAPYAMRYQQLFEPTGKIPEARVGVAVWSICAETDEEAQHLAASGKMMLSMLHRGLLIAVPTPEKAEQWLKSEGAMGQPRGRRMIVGSPKTVREGIEAVAREYDAAEVFVVNLMYDHAARKRSYELTARAYELKPEL